MPLPCTDTVASRVSIFGFLCPVWGECLFTLVKCELNPLTEHGMTGVLEFPFSFGSSKPTGAPLPLFTWSPVKRPYWGIARGLAGTLEGIKGRSDLKTVTCSEAGVADRKWKEAAQSGRKCGGRWGGGTPLVETWEQEHLASQALLRAPAGTLTVGWCWCGF